MSSILDEIRADQDPRAQCKFCLWLGQQPAAERAQWQEASGDRAYTHASIFRAARNHGYGGGQGSIENHRKALHR